MNCSAFFCEPVSPQYCRKQASSRQLNRRQFGFLANRRPATTLRFAFSCWVRDKNRLRKNPLPRPKTLPIAGAMQIQLGEGRA